MGKHIQRLTLLTIGVALCACAGNDGTPSADASWNLTCAQDSDLRCVIPPSTCFGEVGRRSIVGALGDMACNDERISVACSASARPDGGRTLFLEARVGSDFGFELRGATVGAEAGRVEPGGCFVNIVENGIPYGGLAFGACGSEPPSMEQPCQLSNVVSQNGEVSFDLECHSLMSETLGTLEGYDLVGLGQQRGPTTISFSNCSGI